MLTKIKPRIKVQRHCAFAAENGHLGVVRLLVEVGANKNQATNQGARPVRTAAQNGHLNFVPHLIEVGADKDQATNQGARPCFIGSSSRPFCFCWLTLRALTT